MPYRVMLQAQLPPVLYRALAREATAQQTSMSKLLEVILRERYAAQPLPATKEA